MTTSIAVVLAVLTMWSPGAGARFAATLDAPRVQVKSGVLEGLVLDSGVRRYAGIPYAAAPTGGRRWAAPAAVPRWSGVREARSFGARCMQGAHPDLILRSREVSEDCLYLNVWSPAPTRGLVPVLVYLHGGGFSSGDGSEPRHDGAALAAQGLVVVTVNYRLGVFGFLAHRDLTGESPHRASGNYGLLDQIAALRWVQNNIGAFGGDARRVTIAGPSAGAESVSGLMASPLAAGLFGGAILSSGALISPARTVPVPLSRAETFGDGYVAESRAGTLEALRQVPAPDVLESSTAYIRKRLSRFPLVVDGHVFPETPEDTFARGAQAKVPVLLGWNSREQDERAVLGRDLATPESFQRALQKVFADRADAAGQHYRGATPHEWRVAARDLGTDLFMGYPMWRLAELHVQTSKQSVYRYLFDHPRPRPAGSAVYAQVPGASHGDEIEYAMGTLSSVAGIQWSEADREVERLLTQTVVSFVTTGRPQLDVAWTATAPEQWSVFHVASPASQASDGHRRRYQFLEAALSRRASR